MWFGINKKIVTFHNSVLFCSWIYDWCLFKQCECQITEFFHLLLPFFSTTKCHFFDHLQLAAGKSLAETTEPKGSCHFQMEENKNLKETRGKGDGRTSAVYVSKHSKTHFHSCFKSCLQCPANTIFKMQLLSFSERNSLQNEAQTRHTYVHEPISQKNSDGHFRSYRELVYVIFVWKNCSCQFTSQFKFLIYNKKSKEVTDYLVGFLKSNLPKDGQRAISKKLL